MPTNPTDRHAHLSGPHTWEMAADAYGARKRQVHPSPSNATPSIGSSLNACHARATMSTTLRMVLAGVSVNGIVPLTQVRYLVSRSTPAFDSERGR